MLSIFDLTACFWIIASEEDEYHYFVDVDEHFFLWIDLLIDNHLVSISQYLEHLGV